MYYTDYRIYILLMTKMIQIIDDYLKKDVYSDYYEFQFHNVEMSWSISILSR